MRRDSPAKGRIPYPPPSKRSATSVAARRECGTGWHFEVALAIGSNTKGRGNWPLPCSRRLGSDLVRPPQPRGDPAARVRGVGGLADGGVPICCCTQRRSAPSERSHVAKVCRTVTHTNQGQFQRRTTASDASTVCRVGSAMSKAFPLDGLSSPRTKKVPETTPTQPGAPTPAELEDFGRRQLRGDQAGLARPPRTTASDADVARNTQAPDRRGSTRLRSSRSEERRTALGQRLRPLAARQPPHSLRLRRTRTASTRKRID